MSIFVVRFVNATDAAFCGKVRHVVTGEEAGFSSPAELVAFMEEMNVVSHLSTVRSAPPPSAGQLKTSEAGRRPQHKGGGDGSENVIT